MSIRSSIGAVVVAAALSVTLVGARAFDEARYPSWKGQWLGTVSGANSPWDPSKPAGLGQQPPLTPEYQAIFEASVKDQADGGFGNDATHRCIPAGVPRVMMALQPMEIVITPDATYLMLEQFSTLRRIYTDGRAFPADFEASFTGYSIGKWDDTDRDGRFDTLTIETRGIKGPHAYDGSGIPFHDDGEASVREKISADKSDANMLHNEISVTDKALTRPWTVTRSYRRAVQNARPTWTEFNCTEDNRNVQIGKESYKIGDDGLLTPVRRGQPAPDLRYFK